MNDEDRYLHELTSRLEAVLGARLLGVYAGGSYALGGYEPRQSDLDVAVVVASALSPGQKRRLAAAVSHEALPCPARGLELVVYRLEAVGTPTVDPAFELNLNTGARMPFRLDLEPQPGEQHWFALDRAILSEHGIPITGPPAKELFAPFPRERVLPLLRDSLAWYLREEAPADDAVLNACRALRYDAESVWSSKADAGEWALTQVTDASVVRAALDARLGAAAPEPAASRSFVRAALDRLGTTRARPGGAAPAPRRP